MAPGIVREIAVVHYLTRTKHKSVLFPTEKVNVLFILGRDAITCIHREYILTSQMFVIFLSSDVGCARPSEVSHGRTYPH